MTLRTTWAHTQQAEFISTHPKMRNVEVKAEVSDWEDLLKRAKEVSGEEGVVLEQMDIFFHSPNGRLKMRSVSKDGQELHELIWYERNDQEGPKLSTYNKINYGSSQEAKEIAELLKNSNGTRGEVKKRRVLFMAGQTRIHCDDVEGLGKYAELEVVLRDDQSVEEGEKVAASLMASLGLSRLVHCAYIDLLAQRK